MPHFGGSCAKILFATVSGVVPGYGVLLVAKMFVYFCLEHLLDGSGKQLFQFRLNVSGGSDQQVDLTVCRQHLHQFHLSLVYRLLASLYRVRSFYELFYQHLTGAPSLSVGIIGIYTVRHSDSVRPYLRL